MDLNNSFSKIYQNLTIEKRIIFSAIKRFSELYSADKNFRQICKSRDWNSTEIKKYLGEYKIYESIPEEFFNDLKGISPNNDESSSVRALIKEWKVFYEKKLDYRENLKKCTQESISNKYVRSWRSRVIKQNTALMDSSFLDGNVYPLFAIELSDGCSVGCPFCGVGAKGLKEHFLATENNVALFKSILVKIRSNFGDFSGLSGFLYWATEPLDNPDYQIFEKIYSETLGFTPQLTTAIAYKDSDRIRSIINNHSKSRVSPHRFSVLSMGALRRIYKEFTPEELLDVEIIPQMKGSLVVKANAGKNYSSTHNENTPDTIACVAGLLISMTKKEVKIISPCSANEKYPLGYITYDTKNFTNSHEFNEILKAWEKLYFDINPKSDDIISLWSEVNFSNIIESGVIKTRNIDFDFSKNIITKFLIKKVYNDNCISMKDLMLSVVEKKYDVFSTLGVINSLVAEGIFNINRLSKKTKKPIPINFV